jgi:RND family efflux transporter MFP subunit
MITTIVSLDPIHAFFDADEQAFLKYQKLEGKPTGEENTEGKNPIFAGLADEPDEFPHRGHLDFFDNRMDAETGTMRGQAILPNPDLKLTPGLFARLRIPGSERYEAVLVPDFAVSADQSEKFVLLVNTEGKVERRNVKLGPSVRNLRVVREGLDGSEQLILRGLQRVMPGVEVVVKTETLALDAEGLPNDFERVPKHEWLSQPRSNLRPVDERELANAAGESRLPVSKRAN